MILTHLVEYTERLPDLPPTGYQPAFVTKVIRLGADGSFRDVVSASGETRGKREGKTIMAPREAPQRTVATQPRLLCDNANYTLGRLREKDKPEQVELRHQAYRNLVRECWEATREPTVGALHTWLEGGGADALRASEEIADDDEIAIEVDGVMPVTLPAVRRFWADRADRQQSGVCLVTGRHGPIVDRMPAPIKGIPESQVSGAALVSVNNAAGCSFGLEAAYNSPIGADAAERICNGLNRLLASKQNSLRVGKAVYVYWTRNAEPFDMWNLLSKPDPEQVELLLRSPFVGKTQGVVSSPDFFVLALSANSSRIVVRDQMETTLDTVKASLSSWFARLRIDGLDGGAAPAPGLLRLASSLFCEARNVPAHVPTSLEPAARSDLPLFREAKNVPVHVPTALLRSALQGARLPDYLLGLAVRRNQAMQGPYVVVNRQRRLSIDRLALIKAIIQQKEEHPLESLNLQHPDAAYHCGRLLAALERIQRAAVRDINSTVVDRYYGAACASPGSILGALVNDAQAHLGKLRREKRDYHHQLLLEEILSAVGSDFPRTLSLHRQGLFALGFYHQKAYDRAQANAHKESQSGANQ